MVELSEKTSTEKYHLFEDYSERSHVFVGRLPDELRTILKEAKIMTYHPRLFPRMDSFPNGEKGWLIRKDLLASFIEVLETHKIVYDRSPSTRKALGIPSAKKQLSKNICKSLSHALLSEHPVQPVQPVQA